MTGMTENVFINIKNRSHTITAEVEIPEGGARRRDPLPGRPVRRLEPVPEGRQADLHLQLPRPEDSYTIAAPKPCRPARRRSVSSSRMTAASSVRGAWHDPRQRQEVAEGRIERTQGIMFSADEGADVGVDAGTPVTEDYKERDNKFTGKIDKVTVELK